MAKKTKAKAAKKPAAKKKPAKAPAAKMPAGMRPVSTGKGATPAEIGAGLVAAFNTGKGDEYAAKAWSKDIVSCEGVGVGLEWVGRKAVDAKNAEWSQQNTILGASAEGPFVGSTGFAVKFRIHVKDNASGTEKHMDEVGVYTVSNGKIVREEFMYGS
jgi:hypothetical protein